MSAGDMVTYVYEPFFDVSINGTDIQNIINRNDVTASNLIRQNITDLFDCRTYYVKRPGQHKNTKNCQQNPARVIKTIRVRYIHVKSWIERSDIKLIHLLRDPRAMIRSRLVGNIAEKQSKKVCSAMEQDLQLSDILPSDRYIRIKYEHLVENPFETLEMLYKFSGIETTGNIYKILCQKTNGQSNGFYGTERGQTFNPNHWQTESSIAEIRSVEENCQSLMAVLDYSIFNKNRTR